MQRPFDFYFSKRLYISVLGNPIPNQQKTNLLTRTYGSCLCWFGHFWEGDKRLRAKHSMINGLWGERGANTMPMATFHSYIHLSLMCALEDWVAKWKGIQLGSSWTNEQMAWSVLFPKIVARDIISLEGIVNPVKISFIFFPYHLVFLSRPLCKGCDQVQSYPKHLLVTLLLNSQHHTQNVDLPSNFSHLLK